ncbi:SpoIIIAH-like family protein [Cohnella algarum]|uniref:SpoIIIAH-like family protein n=1 Tax=Cohnella algarum TaxID=2044859 RepID=UPI0019678C2C|nr:SpoIIIAH-like family protein [Cohnella algarum]
MGKLLAEQERLNAIIADSKNTTPEEAQSAMEELSRLDAIEERMTSLEEKLVATYGNVVVEEEESNYKVVVQADKLEKDEAVTIVELAMKELEVSPDRLTVQYIP